MGRGDYGPYDYGWGSEGRWAGRPYYGSRDVPWYESWEHDEQRRGPFVGRGPKGYQRSDDRIREDVCDRLTDAPFLDASDVEVTVQNGNVTLSGTVPSREQKWRSEDLIDRVTGVRDVYNNLRVSRVTGGTSVGP